MAHQTICCLGEAEASPGQGFPSAYSRPWVEGPVLHGAKAMCGRGRAAGPQSDVGWVRFARDQQLRERMGSAREETKEAPPGPIII